MTHQFIPELRERARQALERSLGSDAARSAEPLDAKHLARLEAALRSLPQRRREIFLALRFDALSYAQIAHRTGLSRKRVEREVARAMLTLHRAAYEPPPVPWWRRVWRR